MKKLIVLLGLCLLLPVIGRPQDSLSIDLGAKISQFLNDSKKCNLKKIAKIYKKTYKGDQANKGFGKNAGLGKHYYIGLTSDTILSIDHDILSKYYIVRIINNTTKSAIFIYMRGNGTRLEINQLADFTKTTTAIQRLVINRNSNGDKGHTGQYLISDTNGYIYDDCFNPGAEYFRPMKGDEVKTFNKAVAKALALVDKFIL